MAQRHFSLGLFLPLSSSKHGLLLIPSSSETLPAPGIRTKIVRHERTLPVDAWRWQCLTGRGDTYKVPE
jgi:hypothetical protein